MLASGGTVLLVKKYLVLLTFAAALFVPLWWFINQNSSSDQYPAPTLTAPLSTATPGPGPVAPAPEVAKQLVPADQTMTIPILMYHEISTGPDCMWVNEPDFRSQMLYLHDNGYQTITLAQATELLAGHYDTSKKVVLTFDDGYSTFYDHAWPILKEFNQTATLFVISGLVGNQAYMNWEQIIFLDSQGIEIGGHTRSHPLLPTLKAVNAAAEIHQDKEDIQARLGHRITSFCYPTGKYNSQVVQQVQAVGYAAAVTMVQRKASSTDNLLLLPRWGVYQNEPLIRFTTLLQ